MHLVSNRRLAKIFKRIFSIAFLCLTQDQLLKPSSSQSLKNSYMVERGSKFSLVCPHISKKLPVEWKMEGPLQSSQNIGNTGKLTLPFVEFHDSGKYTCNETRVTDEGLRFVLHDTYVLIIEHGCFESKDNSSETAMCRVKYVSDDSTSVQGHRLCKPLQETGTPLDIDPKVDGKSVLLEVSVAKANEDCVYTITHLNSTVRLWPPSAETACYQPMERPSNLSAVSRSNLSEFSRIAIPVLQLLAIAVLVSVICYMLRTYASLNKLTPRTISGKKPASTKTNPASNVFSTYKSGGYEEIPEGIFQQIYLTDYITPM